MYVFLHMYTFICIHIYIYLYIHIYVCIYIYIYVHVYKCTYLCTYIYVYIYVHIYIYIHTHTRICIHTHPNFSHLYVYEYIYEGGYRCKCQEASGPSTRACKARDSAKDSYYYKRFPRTGVALYALCVAVCESLHNLFVAV